MKLTWLKTDKVTNEALKDHEKRLYREQSGPCFHILLLRWTSLGLSHKWEFIELLCPKRLTNNMTLALKMFLNIREIDMYIYMVITLSQTRGSGLSFV